MPHRPNCKLSGHAHHRQSKRDGRWNQRDTDVVLANAQTCHLASQESEDCLGRICDGVSRKHGATAAVEKLDFLARPEAKTSLEVHLRKTVIYAHSRVILRIGHRPTLSRFLSHDRRIRRSHDATRATGRRKEFDLGIRSCLGSVESGDQSGHTGRPARPA